MTRLPREEKVFRHLPLLPDKAYKWDPHEKRLLVKSTAFNDPVQMPSVDIVSMCPHNQPQTFLSKADGVLWLLVGQVRDITEDDKAPANYAFDIVPRPRPSQQPDNEAHAQIEAEPAYRATNHFYKLKVALSRLCQKNSQWEIWPTGVPHH